MTCSNLLDNFRVVTIYKEYLKLINCSAIKIIVKWIHSHNAVDNMTGCSQFKFKFKN
jgi:hypothetical protein